MGANLMRIPGDLGDVRFNYYILEHFFRWVTGLEKSYWSASFFYPYPNTIAFSDNLLGSAPIYLIFRLLSLDRETAYQCWYIVGFFLNYLSSAYVLTKLEFKPLAISAGAFFFTFGLPLLFQENHPQLLYRFGIPLSCYFLWQFAKKIDLKMLCGTILFAAWQLYLGIYNGVFLAYLLVVLAALIPMWKTTLPFKLRFLFWPRQIYASWKRAVWKYRFITIFILAGTAYGIIALLVPYFQITKTYGFTRPWSEVTTMLPQWRSFLLADGSKIWGQFSSLITGVPVRYEHQLFPGMTVIIFLATGLILRPKTGKRDIAWINLASFTILIGLTFYVHKLTLYWAIWQIPGMNSIRALTRIMLVLMWPIAVFAAYGVEALLNLKSRFSLGIQICAAFLLIFMVAESALVNHASFIKSDAQNRVAKIRDQIPTSLPPDPILIFGSQTDANWYANELDSMLAAQEINMPIFNGYSGNYPPSYGATTSCVRLPRRILAYMDFAHITNESFYIDLMKRTVPVGFDDCYENWWEKEPTVSKYAGAFPDAIFNGIHLKIISAKKADKILRVKVEIANQSDTDLSVYSTTKNYFLLSWRYIDRNNSQPLSEFTARIPLDLDIHAGEKTEITFSVTPPPVPGSYRIEVAALQEGIAWFSERGGVNSVSDFLINLDEQNKISVGLN